MRIVQSIMVCYGISMELPVIRCPAGSQRLDSTYYFLKRGDSGTKAKDRGCGGMGNCIGRNGVQ